MPATSPLTEHELELHPHSRYQDCLMAMWFAEAAAREDEAGNLDSSIEAWGVYY